jgi:cysteine synthase A
MPESMSQERRVLLRLLGAELVLTPARRACAAPSRRPRRSRARRRTRSSRSSSRTRQSRHPPPTTANELWDDTDGQIDVLISGVGPGGTITGVSEV